MNTYYRGSDSISKTEISLGDWDLRVTHSAVRQNNHRVRDTDTVPHYSTSLPWEPKIGGTRRHLKQTAVTSFRVVLIKHAEHSSLLTETPINTGKECSPGWNDYWSRGIIPAVELLRGWTASSSAKKKNKSGRVSPFAAQRFRKEKRT